MLNIDKLQSDTIMIIIYFVVFIHTNFYIHYVGSVKSKMRNVKM